MQDCSRTGIWGELPHVEVPGNPNARSREEDPKMESWDLVAIMRVTPRVPFSLWYISVFSPIPQINNAPHTSGLFGARPGPEDVTFGAVAVYPEDMPRLKLELVEIVSIDDPRYANYPFY